MKFILVCLSCLFSSFLFAQKAALLSKDFKKPIIFTDSVTVEQVSSGYFPVEIQNFDTLYASLKYLTNMLQDRQRAKMKSFEFRAGTTIIQIAAVPQAYGDRFAIRAVSKINEIESFFNLTAKRNNNAHNSKRLRELMAYMEKNKSWFKKAYEIHPRFYNVVVVTE